MHLRYFLFMTLLVVVAIPFLPSGYFCVQEEAFKSSVRLIEEVGCNNTHFILVHANGSDQVHLASGGVGYSFHVGRY